MKIILTLIMLLPSISFSYDKNELICISAFSIGRDVYESQGDKESYKLLTSYQNELYLKYDSGHFPSAHVEARKILLNQKWQGDSSFLPNLISDCIDKL